MSPTAAGGDGLDDMLTKAAYARSPIWRFEMGARRPKTELYCHLVWATWDRQPLISPGSETRLHAAMLAKLVEFRCRDITIGGVADHVHVACRFPPTVAIAELVKQVKGASSHCMTHAIGVPEFKWQGGYGAFTFGKKSLPRVAAYVANQRSHHADGTVAPDLEQTEENDDA